MIVLPVLYPNSPSFQVLNSQLDFLSSPLPFFSPRVLIEESHSPLRSEYPGADVGNLSFRLSFLLLIYIFIIYSSLTRFFLPFSASFMTTLFSFGSCGLRGPYRFFAVALILPPLFQAIFNHPGRRYRLPPDNRLYQGDFSPSFL